MLMTRKRGRKSIHEGRDQNKFVHFTINEDDWLAFRRICLRDNMPPVEGLKQLIRLSTKHGRKRRPEGLSASIHSDQGIIWRINSEVSMYLLLRERLPILLPLMKTACIQTSYPDLEIEMRDGSVRYYELEYYLSNFLRHKHHIDHRQCDGIIYWQDDRNTVKQAEFDVSLDILENKYHLICLADHRFEPI